MDSIISLSHEEVRRVLMSPEAYCTLELPEYFSFEEILVACDSICKKNPIWLNQRGNISRSYANQSPGKLTDLNYEILHNKDGEYAWRPFHLVHPVLYTELVYAITSRESWREIQERFKKLQSDSRIKCLSMPPDVSKTKKANTIINWWHDIEQASLANAISYKYLTNTDISDFYPSIYTHSIAWAIHEKRVAKSDRGLSLLGNLIDSLLQDQQNRQTNGIAQGNVVSDLLAELLLAYADFKFLEKMDSESPDIDFKILRYRDDYRIFTQSKEDAQLILKNLTIVLQTLNLKLNSSKTMIFDDIIVGAIKPDKYFRISHLAETDNLLNDLLLIYDVSKKFANSGTVLRLLNKFRGRIEQLAGAPKNTPVLLSVLAKIMVRNPRAYPLIISVASALLEPKNDDEVIAYLEKFVRLLSDLPNTAFIEIWTQRLYYKVDPSRVFTGNQLCECVSQATGNIWNFEWMKNPERSRLEGCSIVDPNVLNNMPRTIERDEVDPFKNAYGMFASLSFDFEEA